MILPGLKTFLLPARRVLLNKERLWPGEGIVVNSAVTDAGNGLARTSLIRQGFVVVKKTADGTYYSAADAANGDRCAPPAVSSIGTGDGTWNSATVTVTVNGGVATTFTLGGATATAAAAVVDLNALAPFVDLGLIADVSATFVRIRSKRGGATEYLTCSSSAATFYGAGVTLGGVGTDADYRVIGYSGEGGAIVDLLDALAVAANAGAENAKAGNFVLANLINLTAEAQAVLSRRGSFFG